MMFIDEPRTMMVAVLDSSSCWSKMVHQVEPISLTYTLEHEPRSSGVGGSSLTRLFAPVVRHSRRSSNLLGHLSTIILYFSTKCSASSPIDWPHTTTLAPASAIALIVASSAASSELLYSLSSSALFSSTVPLVSVVAESSGTPYTTTLASCTSEIVPATLRVKHSPLTTVVAATELPTILATRTLSVLKLRTFSGMASTHASAILPANRSSLPHCLEAMLDLMEAASLSGEAKTSTGALYVTSFSSSSS